MKKIQTLCKDYPEMYYYESMVHALQGHVKEAEKSYRNFVRRR